MKKNLLLGLAMVAAAVIPAKADLALTSTFSRDNVILPSSFWTPDQPWSASVWVVNTGQRYEGAQGSDNPNYNKIWGTPSNDSSGKKWYEEGYVLTDGDYDGNTISWSTQTAPFSTDEYYQGQKSFQWVNGDIMGDIYIIRKFNLDAVTSSDIYLACGHDDAPSEWYINGTMVHSVSDGWKNEEVKLLTAEQKALLRAGENTLAVHVHQNWGGAFADCGLYKAIQGAQIAPHFDFGGAWDCVYKLLDENDQIAGAVEGGCFALSTSEADWTKAQGPFSNSDDKWRTTFWDSSSHPILVRRHFTLSASDYQKIKEGGKLTIVCSYDEFPVVYLNGSRICNWDGWNDNSYASYTLSSADIAKLVVGDNVIGTSLQKGGGGGHFDIGLSVDFLPIEDAQNILAGLLEQAKSLPQTPYLENAVSNAESATTFSEITDATQALQNAINVVNGAKNDIQAFLDTKSLFTDEEAQKQFDEATNGEGYANALRTLRYARRVSVAEIHEDVFEGNVPEDGGKYYLYNVGRKQFLQGGSDWGAHAALGQPGIELTFAERTDQDHSNVSEAYKGFIIQTGLHNGEAPHDYFTSGGYLDGDANGGSGGFIFIPIAEGSKTYVFAQADWGNNYARWNPYGRTDNGNNDETNICTETKYEGENFAEWTANAVKDPYAQWKLVTREERDALMELATEDHPVDISYQLENPGFNQRDPLNTWEWSGDNTHIWDRGGNHYDFVFESWDSDETELYLPIEDLPAGKYIVSVQGYYRNGSYENQVNDTQAQNAIFYADTDESPAEVRLPNILAESGKAPGEGEKRASESGVVYDVPNSCVQATSFFKLGLYKTSLTIRKEEGSKLTIGITKEGSRKQGDWVVVDNFRLYYLGNSDTDAVKGIEDVLESVDGPIYNLQGIRVKDASAPGIYIQNGKKFIVVK